jgi:hypothetical protein
VLLDTVSKKHAAFLQFSVPIMIYWSTFKFLILCGTRFEVLTVAEIHCVFWVRTLYGLVHVNVLVDHSGFIFPVHWKIQALYLHQNLSTHKSHYTAL